MARGERGGGRRRGRGRGQGRVASNNPGNHSGGFIASFLPRENRSPLNNWKDNGHSRSHFSLSEEARNTERHHLWSSDHKLRHSRIAFVSAGTSKAEELTQVPQKKTPEVRRHLQEEGDKDIIKISERITDKLGIATETAFSKMSLSHSHSDMVRIDDPEALTPGTPGIEFTQDRAESPHLFFIDSKGSTQPMHTGFSPPVIRRSPSPAVSDSSSEVILFTGRNGRKNTRIQSHKEGSAGARSVDRLSNESEGLPGPRSMGSAHQIAVAVLDEPMGPWGAQDSSTQIPNPRQEQTATARAEVVDPLNLHIRKSHLASANCERRRRRGRSRRSRKDAEIMDDYIANASEFLGIDDFAENTGLVGRDLGCSEAEEMVAHERDAAAESSTNISKKSLADWDSADLHDLDELSTSSESLVTVKHILSKRERPSGVQYLVVGLGLTNDDARWLPVSVLTTTAAEKELRKFQEREATVDRPFLADDDSDDSLATDEQLALDLQNDLDDLLDERDVEERRKRKMTDEQIATLLSKQEELGMGSADLLLLDGNDPAEMEMQEAQLDGTWDRAPPSRSQPKIKRKKHHQPSLATANTFLDILDQNPYDGFDIMDQDRPSLRKLRKGRPRQFPLELSDSEVEQELTKFWETDRTKKKIRKQEREELRAQGLLGRKGKVDMKAKYSEGMSMEQLKAEIRDFLLSSMESLSLPPMAKKERKLVHEIANVYKLKSKSSGGGKSRYPILYRTARTTTYDEKGLSIIDATLSSNRFFSRLDKAKKRGFPTSKARGGLVSANVSYRDGEVVGATAPELGQENKGRAMLEKMGWSTGKVLGALNNTRGIVHPVTQTVKTGKAGLG